MNQDAMITLTGQPGQTALVLDSPHSGHVMPADFGSLRSERELREGEDCFIDELYGQATARGVPLLAANFPRTYLDANRHEDDIDLSMLDGPWPKPVPDSGKAAIGKALAWRTLGDGLPIYGRLLSVAEMQSRIERCHRPYHAALRRLLDAAHARHGAVWHINCHSMGSSSTVEMEGTAGQPRVDIVLGDRDGTTCAPAFTAFVRDFLARRGYEVRVNEPFKGVELVRAYSDPAAGRHSLQLEINKRLYMDEASLAKTAGFHKLQADLLALVDALLVWTAEASTPPVELQPPDLSRWRVGNTGVEGVWVFDGAHPGPNVMVQALTHGNEICGAIALDWLLNLMHEGTAPWRPLCGRLTLVFGNLAAYDRFDAKNPFASRCVDEDFNRVWADAVLNGSGDSIEKRRARALRPFVDAADLLLDIHSMSEPCRPLMVCGRMDKNAAFARALGQPADLLIDTGHPAGLRMIERGAFGDPASPKKALLIECGQHWERAAADVAVDALVRFLGLTGLASAAWVQANARVPLPAEQKLVRVTEPVVARSKHFRFLVPPVGLGVVAKAGTPIAQDGEQTWTAPYDDTVLVMPGTKNLLPGGTAVRLGRFEPA
jgi:N-formylglutamate amidohydrolase/predicted deacylase